MASVAFWMRLAGGHVLEGHQVVAFVGQLDQKNARIAEHGDLAQGFHLARTAVARVAQLGHAVDDKGHFLAELAGEFFLDAFQAFARVFDAVVQQPGDGPGFVAHQVVEEGRHPAAVGLEVGLAAHPFLPGVHLLAPAVGFGDGRRARDEFPGMKFFG